MRVALSLILRLSSSPPPHPPRSPTSPLFLPLSPVPPSILAFHFLPLSMPTPPTPNPMPSHTSILPLLSPPPLPDPPPRRPLPASPPLYSTRHAVQVLCEQGSTQYPFSSSFVVCGAEQKEVAAIWQYGTPLFMPARGGGQSVCLCCAAHDCSPAAFPLPLPTPHFPLPLPTPHFPLPLPTPPFPLPLPTPPFPLPLPTPPFPLLLPTPPFPPLPFPPFLSSFLLPPSSFPFVLSTLLSLPYCTARGVQRARGYGKLVQKEIAAIQQYGAPLFMPGEGGSPGGMPPSFGHSPSVPRQPMSHRMQQRLGNQQGPTHEPPHAAATGGRGGALSPVIPSFPSYSISFHRTPPHSIALHLIPTHSVVCLSSQGGRSATPGMTGSEAATEMGVGEEVQEGETTTSLCKRQGDKGESRPNQGRGGGMRKRGREARENAQLSNPTPYSPVLPHFLTSPSTLPLSPAPLFRF
ncbi:unnamed protein product [Closterium sp. Naga37s-1]|nr:unnamed protein product [Closterium sp. Naga37s-1]